MQNNTAKVTVAPDKAQPGEPTAGQGRWSGSVQAGRLRGTRRGRGESSWDEREERSGESSPQEHSLFTLAEQA